MQSVDISTLSHIQLKGLCKDYKTHPKIANKGIKCTASKKVLTDVLTEIQKSSAGKSSPPKGKSSPPKGKSSPPKGKSSPSKYSYQELREFRKKHLEHPAMKGIKGTAKADVLLAAMKLVKASPKSKPKPVSPKSKPNPAAKTGCLDPKEKCVTGKICSVHSKRCLQKDGPTIKSKKDAIVVKYHGKDVWGTHEALVKMFGEEYVQKHVSHKKPASPVRKPASPVRSPMSSPVRKPASPVRSPVRSPVSSPVRKPASPVRKGEPPIFSLKNEDTFRQEIRKCLVMLD